MPTALIVDDKTENLYLLEVLLKGHGYQVQTAAHGGEALALARQAPPDIIITDILMPVMDGFALCRQWKQDAALKQIPFVFYTATYTDDKDKQFGLSLGADCFIVKPAEPSDFIQIITEVLDKARSGTWAPPREAPAASEDVYLREYNQALVRKLEQKVLDLETANRALTQAEAELRRRNAGLAQHVAERTQELRDAQEQLIRQERLALLGRLAGGVAHELRNPLGVIANSVYYLKLVLPDPSPAIQEYLEILSAEVGNAERIVAGLLDYAQTPMADRGAIKLTELTAQALRATSTPAQVKVVTDLPASLPDVYVDARQIQQVLVNLLINACQAMPGGGQLTLTAQAAGDQVALSIADTGSGIAPEHMGRLFEPLFTTKARGIGLGLALSKKLAEANGGKIEVRSEPGRGSTFTVTLPVQEIGRAHV
jgi:signal transduction histidine kinase